MKIYKLFMMLALGVLAMGSVGCSSDKDDEPTPAPDPTQIDPLEGGAPMDFLQKALAGEIEGDLKFDVGRMYTKDPSQEDWRFKSQIRDIIYGERGDGGTPVPVKDSKFYVRYFSDNAQNDFMGGGNPMLPGFDPGSFILEAAWKRYCFLEDRTLVPYVAVPLTYDATNKNVRFGALDLDLSQQNSKGIKLSYEESDDNMDWLYTYTYVYSPFDPQTESQRLYYSTLEELYNDLLNRIEEKIGNEIPVTNPEQYGIGKWEFERVPIDVVRQYLFDVELHKWVGLEGETE